MPPPTGVDKELIDKPYFHGLLPREDVDEMLPEKGDFLLRVTEPAVGSAQSVVISVNHDHDRLHYVIRHGADGFHCERNPQPTIPAMIDRYIDKEVPLDGAGTVVIRRPFGRREWELRHRDVRLEKKLGEGAYGEVWRGTLDDAAKTKVAVKQNHLASLNKEQIKEVMAEARVIRHNQHPNVVRLIGVAALEEPLLIVMEMATHGALDSYLQRHGAGLTAARKTDMCSDVATALCFLKQRNVLHRDLAARNCLLFGVGGDVVKLSDFGKSQPGPTYTMQPSERLPIRWLAPETMRTREFSFATEVWSFGVLCWEIFANGQDPYPGMRVIEVNQRVVNGHRPTMPDATPAAIRLLFERSVFVDAPQRMDICAVASRIKPPQPTTPHHHHHRDRSSHHSVRGQAGTSVRHHGGCKGKGSHRRKKSSSNLRSRNDFHGPSKKDDDDDESTDASKKDSGSSKSKKDNGAKK